MIRPTILVSAILFVTALCIYGVSKAGWGVSRTGQPLGLGERVASPVLETAAPTDDSTTAWADMDRVERKNYMRNEVLPRMKKLFVAYNAETYGAMKCATCHGDGARTGEYTMPNPKLGKLPKTTAGMKALTEQSPAMMKFMTDKVKPEMAALLGMKPQDSRSKKGFGCGNCHLSHK